MKTKLVACVLMLPLVIIGGYYILCALLKAISPLISVLLSEQYFILSHTIALILFWLGALLLSEKEKIENQ